MLARHDGPPNGGALLARLGRHLTRHFLDEEVKLGIVRRHVRGQNGTVERVGLGVERHRMADQIRVHAQLGGSVGRSGEGDHILPLQTVQQITRAADHQLQTAFGQQARTVHQADCSLREIAGRRRRFADAGHARQKAGCKFFEQAPNGEIEGVDVHRHTPAWYQNVRTRKAAFLAQRHGRAFVHQIARRQLVARHAGIGKQGARAALNVDPAVSAGGAGVGRDGIQLFLVLAQVFGQCLEALSALLKIHRHQGGQAGGARIGDGLAKIDGFGVGLCYRTAVDGTAQHLRRRLAYPAAGDQTLKGCGHGESRLSMK